MRYLIGLVALLFCWQAGTLKSAAQEPPATVAGGTLVAEKLHYDISFLWLNRAAEAQISLQPDGHDGRFRVELEAKTLGLSAWATGDRRQRFVSLVQKDEKGVLRTLKHDSDTHSTKRGATRSRLKHLRYDAKGRKIIQQVVRNGNRNPEEVFSLDGPMPFDFLAGFYNFRAGAFGPLTVGAQFRIPTFARGQESEIKVRVLTSEETLRARLPSNGLAIRVNMDPEVFDTGDGTVYVWFDAQGRPARVIVKNVVGFGDVRGTLRP